MSEAIQPWMQTLITAAVGPVLLGVGTLVLSRIKRRDEKKDQVLTAKERLAQSTDTQARELIDDLGQQLKNCFVERREVELDRDRGWNLSRWWNERTHNVRHAYRNRLHIANARLAAAGLEPVAEPDIVIPDDLEAPIPKR